MVPLSAQLSSPGLGPALVLAVLNAAPVTGAAVLASISPQCEVTPVARASLRVSDLGRGVIATQRSASAVHVDEIDADVVLATERLQDGTQGGGSTAGAADHPAEVIRIDPDLQCLAPTGEARDVGVAEDRCDWICGEYCVDNQVPRAFVGVGNGFEMASFEFFADRKLVARATAV